MRLKVVINGTPFHYGLARLSYKPLAYTGLFRDLPDVPCVDYSGGVLNSSYDSLSEPGRMGRSQRPGIYIHPQTCAGGTMTLPFISNENWITPATIHPGEEISQVYSSELTFRAMGEITLEQFVELRSAASGSNQSVNIAIYAWADDIKFAGPSTTFTLQSLELQAGDEYMPDGVISSVASAIACSARALSYVPVIGIYAKATEYAANATAAIARLFGYTNPPLLEDIRSVKITQLPNLANTQMSKHSEKLTLDPRNELTIDPRTIGHDNVDELSIAYLASRESYVTQAVWATTDSKGTILQTINVSPQNVIIESGTGGYAIQQTPLSFISQLYDHWRGDIIYRFAFPASQYHRGRVRITYEPQPYPDGSFAFDHVKQFNEVVDLSQTTDFEFRVPYLGRSAFRKVLSRPTDPNWAINYPGNYNDRHHNGVVTVSVMTELSSPFIGADINFAIFVRGADNFELAEPSKFIVSEETHGTLPTVLSPYGYVLQADDITLPGQKEADGLATVQSTPGDNSLLVYMGESVRSVRDLFHRTTRYMTINGSTNNNPTLTGIIINYFVTYLPRFPIFIGQRLINPYSSLVTNLHETSNNLAYNFVHTPVYSHVTTAFVGWRGSIEYRAADLGSASYNGNTYSPCATIEISRCHNNNMSSDLGPHVYQNLIDNADSTIPFGDFQNIANSASAGMSLLRQNGVSGMAASAARVDPVCTAIAPMYSDKRMYSANPNAQGSPYCCVQLSDAASSGDSIRIDYTILASNKISTQIDVYTMAGPDYTPFFFLNVPTMYVADSLPTPLQFTQS
jgi:hypothetical protein